MQGAYRLPEVGPLVVARVERGRGDGAKERGGRGGGGPRLCTPPGCAPRRVTREM